MKKVKYYIVVAITICKCLSPLYIITLQDDKGKKQTFEVGDYEVDKNKTIRYKDRVYITPDSNLVLGKDTLHYIQLIP